MVFYPKLSLSMFLPFPPHLGGPHSFLNCLSIGGQPSLNCLSASTRPSTVSKCVYQSFHCVTQCPYSFLDCDSKCLRPSLHRVSVPLTTILRCILVPHSFLSTMCLNNTTRRSGSSSPFTLNPNSSPVPLLCVREPLSVPPVSQLPTRSFRWISCASIRSSTLSQASYSFDTVSVYCL